MKPPPPDLTTPASVHWFRERGVPCGAQDGGRWTFACDAVTCRECLAVMRVEVLERRLEVYRRSIALARLRRPDRR